MSDEIKEIIEYFKDDIDYLEEQLKYPNFLGRYITIRDKECEYLRKLLDYITNLQQINKNLTNSLNKKVEEGIKLQLENDKLKEQCKQWKENHKAVCIQRDNILNNTVKDIEEQIDYKSKNEKAIEELENIPINANGGEILEIERKVYHILKGVSNENSNE